MQFQSKSASTCRICGGNDLHPYLDLGAQPPSNSFIESSDIKNEKDFPLIVNLCNVCGLSQLSEVVAATDIFNDYAYLSSTSKALVNHYQEMVDDILSIHPVEAGSLVIDIGCNDGITLGRYPNGKYKIIGVEPSSSGEYAIKAGFEVEKIFFDAESARKLRDKHGMAKILTATNVFAHIDNIKSFVKGVAELLDYDGVFVIEFPYLRDMIDSLYFDTIYHEHLSYLSLTPLVRLFTDHGLRPFMVRRTDVGASGPALRLFICLKNAHFTTDNSIPILLEEERAWGITQKATYSKFAERVATLRSNLLLKIGELNLAGYKVGCYGAPAKGNTMLNYLGLTQKELIAVADNTPIKIGKLTPGTHLPVVSDEEFMRLQISHALLLTWNYAKFFLENSDFINKGGKFIIPFPFVEVLPK